MKKLFLILAVCMVFLLASGVLAENLAVSDDVEEFVKDVVKEKGLSPEKIEKIEKVDFEDLPEEVKIENVDETNLALYEIDYGEEKPVFVLTVSDTTFKKTLKEIANKMMLNFGFEGEVDGSLFLETATGVPGSEEKGYVMMRQGSITGLSTNLEVIEITEFGEVEVIIYKNAKEVGFRNAFIVNSTGINKDYDVISSDTITFEPGDVLSVYVNVEEDIVVKDVITLMEINIFE